MALIIKWTPQAVKGLEIVIAYLELEWTAREILQLENNINKITDLIVLTPEIFPKSNLENHLHKAVVDKNNYLVYRINYNKKIIEIINFRGTKQKPKH